MADRSGDAAPRPESHRPPSRVRAVYDDIASHFSKTRAYPWPEVAQFLERTAEEPQRDRAGAVGLDIGCGNGRHTGPLAGRVETALGVDLSRNLLDEARARLETDEGDERDTAGRPGLVQGDAAAVPVGTNTVDIALYVATIHHLPDRSTRVESLAELSRVLGPGGRALVSAWSTAHDRFGADDDTTEGFDTTVDWTLPGGETVPRFYHIYAPPEFERDLREAGLAVTASEVSSGNCYAEVRPGDREGKRPL